MTLTSDNPETAEQGPGPTEWGESRVGKLPWAEEYPGVPLPTGEHYDPDLLANGDRRNVVDAYRYWTREAIVADIDARRHPLHVAIENFENDANIGTVVRTANAFAVDTVHIVGRRRWNRRGAMVTDRYQHLEHHPDVHSLLVWALRNDLTVVAIDNTPGSVPLETAQLPERCLLLFGQEGPGVTDEARAGALMTCSIAQFGSTRSINAGVAAGIAMHTWIRQHADLENSW
ncbi:RNA methyltransferase, TrmH family [Corynebacterium efficiens YS-314]|uniref:Putative RNA methyltransferase n=1 Tax=Corynebacterium efficiens (strain DSM 44549 / YS-314 / AJ 12310 / JCM 11189 / NBRC 100395) TaxID=196164 RepID=Q8FMA4_COREF|nr:TrmH family RNA methyltransferase [Corynebacterium efficiens]EEW51074.1 RNA methyltransferase, TrmH family [Corynebacterium efficiens YS-314]BAC19413.1 putative RNA methyltransferase [Corynebacterium efficiens YS-314]